MRIFAILALIVLGTQSTLAASPADDFIKAVEVCVRDVNGDDLDTTAKNAGFVSVPQYHSYSKNGVTINADNKTGSCKVSVPYGPLDTAGFRNEFGAVTLLGDSHRKVAWGQKQPLPKPTDYVMQWLVKLKNQGPGVTTVDIKEMPAARERRPLEIALIASVTSNMSEQLALLPLSDLLKQPETMEQVFLSGVAICSKIVREQDVESDVKMAGFTQSGRILFRKIGTHTVTLEVRPGAPCKVYVNGRPDDRFAIEAGIVSFTNSFLPKFIKPESWRKISLPMLGSAGDHEVKLYQQISNFSWATVRLQRNRSAFAAYDPAAFSYVAALDYFKSEKLPVAQNGPIYGAVGDALYACAQAQSEQDLSPIAFKMGHDATGDGDHVRRALGLGNVSLAWDAATNSCVIAVTADAEHYEHATTAVPNWLKTWDGKVTTVELAQSQKIGELNLKRSTFKAASRNGPLEVTILDYDGSPSHDRFSPRIKIWVSHPKN